jgi:PadR family transcriptional regulator PadR
VKKEQDNVERIIERMYAEWRRGMLSYWVLGMLLLKPMYGLEIKEHIKGKTQGKMDLRPSTIYQLLARLEKQGMVTREWAPSTEGPPRAYYQTNAAGREVMRRYLMEVFTPGSPIAAAMGEITGQMFEYFGREGHDLDRAGDPAPR